MIEKNKNDINKNVFQKSRSECNILILIFFNFLIVNKMKKMTFQRAFSIIQFINSFIFTLSLNKS